MGLYEAYRGEFYRRNMLRFIYYTHPRTYPPLHTPTHLRPHTGVLYHAHTWFIRTHARTDTRVYPRAHAYTRFPVWFSASSLYGDEWMNGTEHPQIPYRTYRTYQNRAHITHVHTPFLVYIGVSLPSMLPTQQPLGIVNTSNKQPLPTHTHHTRSLHTQHTMKYTRVFVPSEIFHVKLFTYRSDMHTLAALINSGTKMIHVFDEESPNDDSDGRYISTTHISNFYSFEVDEDGYDITD